MKEKLRRTGKGFFYTMNVFEILLMGTIAILMWVGLSMQNHEITVTEQSTGTILIYHIVLIISIGYLVALVKRLLGKIEYIKHVEREVIKQIQEGTDNVDIKPDIDDKIFRDPVYYIREYMNKYNQQKILTNQAEYVALQRQINPHFLYNTLDTIRGKALENGQKDVAAMIERLSRVYRYSLSGNTSMIALQDELKNVKDYIEIQQMRFPGRFVFKLNIDESDWKLLIFQIPKLILQPLMENAIVHGMETIVSGGEITLNVYRTENKVIMRVEDNGVGMSPEELDTFINDAVTESTRKKSSSGGVALMNIKKRIEFIYGDGSGLNISSAKNYGTTAEIVISYKESSDDKI